jgi:hypothetical protein
MTQVHVHTNLDLYHEQWPTSLPEIPKVGDRIDSMVSHENFRLSLKVVSVHWRYFNNKYTPYIELHDYRQRSISDFYEWYAPLVGKRTTYFI